MPFQAACPFCSTGMKLSRKAVGRSVPCPECGSYFTAAPPEELPTANAPSLRAAAARPVQRPTPATNTALLDRADDRQAGISNAPAPVSIDVSPVDAAATSSDSWTAVPGWVNLWGVAGFFIGSLSLLLASAAYLPYLTIPLAACGVLVILLGFLGSVGEHRVKDRIWLALGGLVSSGVLGAALFRPGLLNDGWTLNAAVPQTDPNQQLLVSPDNRVVKKTLTEAEWVDAGSGSVRMGDLHVRIEGVKVERSSQAAGTPPTAESGRLLIEVTLANAGHVHTYSYAGQATRKHAPALRDSRGRLYMLRDAGVPLRERQVAYAVLRPVTYVEDVLSFEPPSQDIEYLDLEIPAAAWQGQGTCRFRIPRAMIVWPAKYPQARGGR